MVLIIPLSLSFIQQPENYVALLDILVHFFLHQYVVLVRDGQGRKNTSGLSGKMSSVYKLLEKVDSEKFPPK